MINKFTLNIESSVRSALKKIDSNGIGLIIIIDNQNRVYGTLSDGDIRRFIIDGGNINDSVKKCMNKNFVKGSSIKEREELLKKLDRGISAIPIIDSNGILVEIVTREYFPISNDNSYYVRSRAPARISFGGGGSDLTYYFNDNKAAVINSAINLFSHALLIPSSREKIEIFSDDLNIYKEYSSINELKQDTQSDIKLINSTIDMINPSFGFRLEINSDFPIGSGLGGSASVVSSIIGAFNHLRDSKLDNYEMSELAFQAERLKLNIAGGWQDQYASVFGGFNFIEFNNEDNIVHPLRINNETILELEESLILVNTNMYHKSNEIHKDQKKEVSNSKIKTYMKQNVQLSYQIRDCLLRGKLNDFGSLLNEAWVLKKNFSKKITNPKLNNYYELAIKNGAIGGKLLGAGSGGHFIFFTNFKNKFSLIKALNNEGLDISRFSFNLEGLTSWQINY